MKQDEDGEVSRSDRSTLPDGSVVSHYRIDAHLGSGGTADVYLATDLKLKRQVALKVLTAGLMQSASRRERFLKEAQTAAALNHPNIVTVHEFGESDSQMFIAMELVKGETLKQLLARKRLNCAEVVAIASQICDGLSAAHSSGQIHCDIKPENIIINEHGRAEILDFGIARAILTAEREEGVRFEGSLHYLAPEIINGETPDASADLYSLGVLLYQMVTGKLPFEGDYEASLVYAILNEEPPTVRSTVPDIPECLEDLIVKLLQKDRSQRIQDSEQLKQALSICLADRIKDAKTVSLFSKTRLIGVWLPAAVVVAALVYSVIMLMPKTPTGDTSRAIAVLPFENLGLAEDEYFADGITDAITSQLAKISGLKVISRTSAMQFKNSDLDLRDIAAELQVAYLVTGTVYWDRSEGVNQVRINVNLADAEDGTYLWTESYARVLDKIFAIQSDIANHVSHALGVVVLTHEQEAISSEPTASVKAYELYLRGNDYFNRSWDLPDIQIAVEMYQQAVQLDSTFALAYAMLARGHASMFWEFYDRSPERKELALEAANRAVELDPELPGSHLAKGYYFYHCELDYERALAEFETALKLQPNNADLLNAIAAVERRQGKLETAAESFKKALSLDPSSHLKAFDVGLTYGMMRDFSEADRWLDRTIALAPDWPLPYIYKAWLQIFASGDKKKARKILEDASGRCDLSQSKYYWWLARIVEPNFQQVLDETAIGTDSVDYYLHVARINRLMGNRHAERAYSDSARSILERKVKTQREEAHYQSDLCLAYTGLREKEKALEHGRLAVQLLPTTREAFDAPFLIVNLAECLVVFGEYDEAVQMLKQLLSIPGFVSSDYLKLDPLWIPLHDNPEFQNMLKQAA